jgi:hypothetical protein
MLVEFTAARAEIYPFFNLNLALKAAIPMKQEQTNSMNNDFLGTVLILSIASHVCFLNL